SAGAFERSAFSMPRTIDQPVVAMFSWSASTGIQQIHVNGVLVADQNIGSIIPRNPGAFALGAVTSAGGNIYDGEISELRIYNSTDAPNAAPIAAQLPDAYIPGPALDDATLTPTGGRFVLIDTATTQVNAGGTFILVLESTTIDAGDISV